MRWTAIQLLLFSRNMDSPSISMKQRESVDIAPLFLAEHNRSNIVNKQKLSQDCFDLLARGLHDQSITAPVRVGVPEPAPPLLIDKGGLAFCKI